MGEKLLINQLQLSIAHCPMIDAGLNVNIENDRPLTGTGCSKLLRLRGVNHPGMVSSPSTACSQGTFLGSEKFPELNAAIGQLAEKYGATPNAIAIA